MSVIKTYNQNGLQNGEVVPIWHIDQGPPISQVYLTTVFPWCVKGPHLHKIRRGLFCCVYGSVLIVTRVEGKYTTHSLKRGDPALEVPPGVPAAVYNPNGYEALVLNMPEPPWREEERDEWPVEDWDFHL